MEDILNFVLAAVSSRLHTLYPGTAVYAESIPEELPETCFLIGYTGNQEIHKELTGRYQVSGTLDIAYYTPNQDPDMRQRLLQTQAFLSLHMPRVTYQGMMIRLDQHLCRIEDGVLHDLCGFAVWLLESENAAQIQNILLSLEGDYEQRKV